jgi:hypothetical protein
MCEFEVDNEEAGFRAPRSGCVVPDIASVEA